jgi:hypothetical protein
MSRCFTTGLLLTAAARSALAQQPGRQYRIALAHPIIPANQLNENGGKFYHFFSLSCIDWATPKAAILSLSGILLRGIPIDLPISLATS